MQLRSDLEKFARILSHKLENKKQFLTLSSYEDVLEMFAYGYGFKSWNSYLESICNNSEINSTNIYYSKSDKNKDFILTPDVIGVDYFTLFENKLPNSNLLHPYSVSNFILGYSTDRIEKLRMPNILDGSASVVTDYINEHAKIFSDIVEKQNIGAAFLVDNGNLKIDILNSLIYSQAFDGILNVLIKNNHYFTQIWYLIIKYLSDTFSPRFNYVSLRKTISLEFIIFTYKHFLEKNHFLASLLREYLLSIFISNVDNIDIQPIHRKNHYDNCYELLELLDEISLDYNNNYFDYDGILFKDIFSYSDSIYLPKVSFLSQKIIETLCSEFKFTPSFIITTNGQINFKNLKCINFLNYNELNLNNIHCNKANLIFAKSKGGSIIPDDIIVNLVSKSKHIQDNIFCYNSEDLLNLNLNEYYTFIESDILCKKLFKFSFS